MKKAKAHLLETGKKEGKTWWKVSFRVSVGRKKINLGFSSINQKPHYDDRTQSIDHCEVRDSSKDLGVFEFLQSSFHRCCV